MRSRGTTSINFQEGVEEFLTERGGTDGFVAGIRRYFAFEVFPNRLIVGIALAQKREEALLCLLGSSTLLWEKEKLLVTTWVVE